MNNNKRKNRPSGGGGGGGGLTTGGGNISRYSNDSRQPNKSRPQAQGIYNNAFFMHAATALVGNEVQMRLRSGNIYEGVFRTFSPNFDVALELPSCIKFSKNSPDENKSSVPNVMIFPYDTVVSISAKDFDSQYATGGTFQTDAAISEKCNGSRFDAKELEPWDPTGMNGDIDIELDDAANGWDANDMFRKNENQFGVQSTFDDSLSSYTVPLDKLDSDEFKEREAKAEKLAAEIESNPTCRDRLDLENGDEETLYAAVSRPEIERESEREREREREREKRDRDLERERERERERDEREKERERERERERETSKRYVPVPMTERYITKPTRSVTGPPMHVNMAAQSMGGQTPRSGGHGGHGTHDRDDRNDRCDRIDRNDRNDRSDRNDRMMANNSLSSASASGMGQLPNPTQSSAGSGMSGGMKGSALPSSSQIPQDAGNKYQSGGSMMKRKSNAPLNQKMVRNTPPPNNGPGGPSPAGGLSQTVGNINAGGMSQNSNASGGQKQIIYSTMAPMQGQQQSQSSYQPYTPPVMHGGCPGSYRGGGPAKLNGDNTGSVGGGGKPMPQRPMRQYSGSSSNSSMTYTNESPNQIRHTQHGPPHGGQGGNNGSSPPLQSSGGGPHVPGGMSGQQQPPQPQRQMRSRENQLQEFIQFAQDFTLTFIPPSPPPAGQSQPQHMNPNKGHQPQPSVSPPQQQTQQPPHMQQQQAHVPTHPAQQHVSQQHHGGPPPPSSQQQQQHHSGPQSQQPHYGPPHMQHMQQNMALPQQQQQNQKQHIQHVAHNTGAASMAMQHVATQPTPHIMQEQQSVVQVPITQHPQASINVSSPTGPLVTSQQQQTTPPGVSEHTPPQQHQQQTPINKTIDSSTGTPSSLSTTPSDKTSPPAGNTTVVVSASSVSSSATGTPGSVNPSGTSVVSATAPITKKTHVLNPSAKPFTPRSPSTPNPSRPHTPQTPVTMTAIYTQGAQLTAAAGQQTPIYMMPGQQPTAAFHAPTHPQAAQQPRMRRSNYGPMTPSQMHASAATGQPLLATGPLPAQFIPYPQTPHAPHFQSQPYAPPMVRMYEPQQLQFLTQTPPSTTPSPGQPHQSFHPQPQPSPAGGGPQPTFAPQTQQYHVVCPLTLHPTQLMHSPYYQTATAQHPPQGQQFQLIMPQHPAQ